MRFLQALGTFFVVLAACVVGFGILFGILWAWGIGFWWTLDYSKYVTIAYLVGTICILPAISITHTILEDK